ncbi:MAG: HDOD domain-containing protein [Epsilonproteobacteria bacterium]|nr:HDOD domain-containing protein [Campylobacterota bacterium]
MLLMAHREIIKEHLLFLIENAELLLSSKRYDEILEKLVEALHYLHYKHISLYRFLDLFQKIVILLDLKKDTLHDIGDILDFLIMAIDELKEYEDEIYEMDFEKIKLDTFLLQSSRQIFTFKRIIVNNLNILNLLEEAHINKTLREYLKNINFITDLNTKEHFDLVLAPCHKSVIKKIREKTDAPIAVILDNKREDLDEFQHIYYISDKFDETELVEHLTHIVHTYQCRCVSEKINNLDFLEPLSDTVIKLQKLDENASLREISNIISKDIALSVKLVSFVNKPYFGVVKEITSASQAVTFLGREKTLAYIFSMDINDKLGNLNLQNYGISEEKFNRINFLRLELANLWYRKVNFSDFIVVSSAAMLGNIGKIFLDSLITDTNKEEFRKLVSIDRLFAENEILETSTEEVTASLLTYWRFSNELVDSIKYVNNISDALGEMKHLAIVNYVIFNTFDMNDEIDDEVVNNMADFLKEMNFNEALYLDAINKMKEKYQDDSSSQQQ